MYERMLFVSVHIPNIKLYWFYLALGYTHSALAALRMTALSFPHFVRKNKGLRLKVAITILVR